MQTDSHDITDEDEGSLFGSPPPSPPRGRSPSPALALPSGRASTANSTQNVGAIALPGSHYNSEHTINPLASLLSPDPQGTVSQPPVHDQDAASKSSRSQSRAFTPSCLTLSTPSTSRSSSQGPSNHPTKRKQRRQTYDSAPRPPPPDIPLPDPSAPPPANWLRSQSALLGHAGLVGGIKTSTLSNRHTRGMTPSNPIVIADDDDAPAKPKTSSVTRAPIMPFGSIDYAKLPKPTTQDIVQILIKQREIFPVLQDILKLVAKGPLAKTSASCGSRLSRETSSGPPLKKRKLNRVPAGAVDWDVPYPFQEGEGPEEYQSTWERDRGKQLIAQLVSLIKAASRKAALRIHLQKEHFLRRQLEAQRDQTQLLAYALKELDHLMPKVGGHYRPKVASYPTSDLHVLEPLNGHSGSSSGTPPPSYATDSFPVSSPFDDLLSSLLTATQGEDNGSGAHSSPLNALFAPSDSHEPTPELDPEMLDSWVSIFQTFPNSTNSLNLDDPFLSSLTPTDHSAASSVADFSLDFGSWSAPPILDGSQHFSPEAMLPTRSSTDPFPFTAMDVVDSGTVTEHMDTSFFTAGPPQSLNSRDGSLGVLTTTSADSMIDPELLAISIPPDASTLAERRSSISATPSLVASPMPSMSSFGEFDPLTPSSLAPGWDSTENLHSADDTGMFAGMNIDGLAMPGFSMENDPQGCGLTNMELDIGTTSTRKGKGKDTDIPLTSLLPAFMASLDTNAVSLGASSSVFTPPTPRPFLPTDRTSDRAELLKRAKIRRKQLAEEIIKARTQLWETTIEHGVLTRLAKYYN